MSFLKSLFSNLFAAELNELSACKLEIVEKDKTIASLRNQIAILEITDPVAETEEKIIEIPIFPQPFKDETTMRDWFRRCPIRLEQYRSTLYDCDDFSLDTQRLAMEDGYLVNFQVDKSGEYCGGNPHFLCNVVVGNWAILIEPQTGEEVGRLAID